MIYYQIKNIKYVKTTFVYDKVSVTESCRCLCTADEDVSQSQINRIYFRYNYQECLNITIYRYYSELNHDEATEDG